MGDYLKKWFGASLKYRLPKLPTLNPKTSGVKHTNSAPTRGRTVIVLLSQETISRKMNFLRTGDFSNPFLTINQNRPRTGERSHIKFWSFPRKICSLYSSPPPPVLCQRKPFCFSVHMYCFLVVFSILQ